MLMRSSLILALVTAMSWSVASAEEKVTADYLTGRWSLEGAPACHGTMPDSEFIIFDRDGGFRSYRRGRLESAGFWHLGDDYIEFHIVSSVGILNPDLKEYVGSYSMASIDAMETKVERNHLELAVKLGDKMDHWKLDRCKK
jgi:hypothetical protein